MRGKMFGDFSRMGRILWKKIGEGEFSLIFFYQNLFLNFKFACFH